MNQREIVWLKLQSQRLPNLVALGCLVRDKKKEVLSIPPLYVGVMPDAMTDTIDTHKSVPLKQIDPIRRPLLIQMTGPALPWNRCRKQDYRGQAGEPPHQRSRGVPREVLGNLEAQSKVKATPRGRQVGEIDGLEFMGRDEKLVGRYMPAVHPTDGTDPQTLEFGKPSSRTTADIDDAGWVHQRHHHRDYSDGRTRRPTAELGVES